MDGAYQKNINGKKCTILWYIDDPNIFLRNQEFYIYHSINITRVMR